MNAADRYQDPTLNTIEDHPLTSDEFENFLNRRVCTNRCLLKWSTDSGSGCVRPTAATPWSRSIGIYTIDVKLDWVFSFQKADYM